jgi:hypothetical protein
MTTSALRVFAACAAVSIGLYGQGAGTPTPAVPDASSPGQSNQINAVGPRVGVLAYCTDLAGVFGASNTVNTLVADGRFGSVTLVDGDVTQPTAAQLRNQFDCVIAMTDNRCGGTSDSTALAGFVGLGGGAVIATFGYSTSIGFTAPIFAAGLSPYQPVTAGNAPAGLMDIAGASNTGVCSGLMNGVTAPVSSSYANYVSLSAGATQCADYQNGQGLLAINASGNVLGLNTFPAAQSDHTQASYRNLVSNAVYKSCLQNVAIDIKFCSNPNGYNCGKNGKTPVTIFGEPGFDANDIDISSLKLCLASNLSACTTAPKSWSTADRGNPATDIGASSCAVVDGVEQNYLNPDGILDLDVAFDAGEVSSLIGCPLAKGTASPTLVLVGKLLSGRVIQSSPVNNAGVDQLYIQN